MSCQLSINVHLPAELERALVGTRLRRVLVGVVDGLVSWEGKGLRIVPRDDVEVNSGIAAEWSVVIWSVR